MSNALNRFLNTIPKTFNSQEGSVLYALIYAIALSDDDVANAIEEAKKTMMVKRATGKNLEILGRGFGVSKPLTLGMSDDEFRELIPNLSLKPKVIKKAFYDTADIFWGPLFSRANITTSNSAPYNVSVGDAISVKINNQTQQTVKVLTGEIVTNGAATSAEMLAILSKIKYATVSIITDPVLNTDKMNIRTNAPGSVGVVEIISSSMIGVSKLGFVVGEYDILKLSQRVSIYNLKPNELLIEIPSVLPALKRTLKGSHHFHEDSTLETAVAPANGVWTGSFMYNPSGDVQNFAVSHQKAALAQNMTKGSIYTSIAVTDNSLFESATGELIFDFGLATQEGPVKFRGLPNDNTVLLDPSYTFLYNHSLSNGTINVVTQKKPYLPKVNGNDLAIYMTSPSEARAIVQGLLSSLAAAGIFITYKILAPNYRYVIDNPYISSDDAPSS